MGPQDDGHAPTLAAWICADNDGSVDSDDINAMAEQLVSDCKSSDGPPA